MRISTADAEGAVWGTDEESVMIDSPMSAEIIGDNTSLVAGIGRHGLGDAQAGGRTLMSRHEAV